MSLDINLTQKENEVYMVSLTGSIDNSTCPSLDDQIEQLFKLKASTIVLDMEDLKFMSSVGVGLVNRTKNRIKEQGGHFAMVNLQPQIKKVFDIMSLLPTMNVFNDDQELDEYLDKIQHRITEDGTSLGS